MKNIRQHQVFRGSLRITKAQMHSLLHAPRKCTLWHGKNRSLKGAWALGEGKGLLYEVWAQSNGFYCVASAAPYSWGQQLLTFHLTWTKLYLSSFYSSKDELFKHSCRRFCLQHAFICLMCGSTLAYTSVLSSNGSVQFSNIALLDL